MFRFLLLIVAESEGFTGGRITVCCLRAHEAGLMRKAKSKIVVLLSIVEQA